MIQKHSALLPREDEPVLCMMQEKGLAAYWDNGAEQRVCDRWRNASLS